MDRGQENGANQGGTRSSTNSGQDRTVASNPEKPNPVGELLLPGRLGSTDRGVR